MIGLMMLQLFILLIQFIVIVAYLDKSTTIYIRPDYVSHAAQDMVWNRDKFYKD